MAGLPVIQFDMDSTGAETAMRRVSADVVSEVDDALWPIAEAVEREANAAYSGSARAFKARRPPSPGTPIVVAAPWFPVGFLDQGTLAGKVGGTKRKRTPKVRGRNYTGSGIPAREGLKAAVSGKQGDAAKAATRAIEAVARRHGLEVS